MNEEIQCAALWTGKSHKGSNNSEFNPHLPGERCWSKKGCFEVSFDSFIGQVKIIVCFYHRPKVERELKLLGIRFEVKDLRPLKAKKVKAKKIRVCEWCTCGEYLYEWVIESARIGAVQDFRSRHTGEGHVPCGPEESRAARRRRNHT